MSRADLLALSADDLAALTNRGTVRRAERELEAGEPTCQFEETAAGELTCTWSDGITCRFPAGKTIHDAVCSSGSVGISRHVVRAVLAYQRDQAAAAPAAGATAAAPALRAWDPGTLTDEDLAARFRPAALAKARQRFQQGVLVELTRGEKPVARFLDDPCTLRFLVPGDLRYVTADCAEPLLATYVPLAVWAFRALPADRPAGLVSIQQVELPTPAELLEQLDALLVELAADGLAGCPASWPQRLARVEAALRDAGLVWPAELAADLAQQQAMYAGHDARFDPLEAVHLAGELVARGRAIRGRTTAVPQLLIRGTRSDRVTEIAGGRLVGLGLGVRVGRRATTLSAYLQDAESGSLVAVERTFADPEADSGESPKDFAALAATVLTRGISLAALGGSQLLLKAGKRTPSGRLVLPRTGTSLTAHPQAYAWEQLKPPAAVESFGQLAALLEALPPSYLRPRRLTENLHVCPVAGVEEVGFDAAHQRLAAVLADGQGGRALLVHPYHARGRQGFEALAAALNRRGGELRFVAGHVGGDGRGLVIRPVCLVLEKDGRREGLQPWIAPAPAEAAAFAPPQETAAGDPLEQFLQDLRFALSELLLAGLRRADGRTAGAWAELAGHGRRIGLVRLVEPLARLGEMLQRKADTLRWDPQPAARLALDLLLYARMLP